MAHESQLLELITMSDEKPDLENLLGRTNESLREEYGEFGVNIVPQIRTHDAILGLRATLDQQGTANTYDPYDKLQTQLEIAQDRIEDDLQGAIEDEFDE